MRFGIAKEALVASALFLFITFVISYFPFKFEFIKPIKQDFEGFDIYDLKFTGKSNVEIGSKDTNIIIVQAAPTRPEVVDQIKKIQSLSPLVIGVDLSFSGYKTETPTDSELYKLLTHTENIIPGYILKEKTTNGSIITDHFLSADEYFNNGGYFNFSDKDSVSVIRSFAPFYKNEGKLYYSFAARILEKFSPDFFASLKKRKNKTEYINYSRNLKHYITYTTQEFNRFFSEKNQLDHIKGKIVLLGVFSGADEPQVTEDIHFSPMNDKPNGKSMPDIYGVVIHANILSMITGKAAFIKTKSPLFSFFAAFIVSFLTLLFVLWRYIKKAHPSHLGFFILAVTEVILLVYFFLKIFDWFNVRVPLGPVILSVVLSIEMFDIYKAFARWLHKKFKYNTIFKPH